MLRITRLNAYSVFHHITDQSGVLQLMLQGLDKILRNLKAHPQLMIWIRRLLKTFVNAGLRVKPGLIYWSLARYFGARGHDLGHTADADTFSG